MTRNHRLVLLGVAGLYLLVGVLFAKVIYPIDDEAVFANPAYNFITHGNFGTNILDHNNTLRGLETRTYWFQPLYPLLLSGWFEVVPVSLFNQRLLSVGWGLSALAAWFLTSVRLARNVWCAATVTLALSLDYIFLSAVGTGRMDMMSAALSWLGVALYLQSRERSLPRAVFMAWSMCALNVVTHPLGAILGALNLSSSSSSWISPNSDSASSFPPPFHSFLSAGSGRSTSCKAQATSSRNS